jgi:hypothetical protein
LLKGQRNSYINRERRLLFQRPEHEVGTFHDPDPRQDGNFVAKRRIGFEKPIILSNSGCGVVTPLSIYHVKLRPRWSKRHATMVTVSLTILLKYRLAGQVLKSNNSIDQASVEENPAPEAGAEDRSARAVVMARCAKAAISTQGSADPPLFISSITIRRPGSSIMVCPRRPSSASNVDLPSPEQPEITTNRFTRISYAASA